MPTTTTTTEKTGAKPKMAPTPEFFGSMWDTASKAQRQWYNYWAQPFGFEPAPEKMWKHWQLLGDEYLNETEKSFNRMKDYVSAEVRLVRDFSDKTLEMTKELAREKAEPGKMPSELAREWFDTSRRCMERTFEFGTDTVRATEEFGLKMSEMMLTEPIEKGC
jgi:hypothetical protein